MFAIAAILGTFRFHFNHRFIPTALLAKSDKIPPESMADTGFPVQYQIPANTLQRFAG